MSWFYFVAIAALLFTSAGLATLVYFKNRQAPAPAKIQVEAIGDASVLLTRLLKGRAVVVVDVMDYNEILRWSPKQRIDE